MVKVFWFWLLAGFDFDGAAAAAAAAQEAKHSRQTKGILLRRNRKKASVCGGSVSRSAAAAVAAAARSFVCLASGSFWREMDTVVHLPTSRSTYLLLPTYLSRVGNLWYLHTTYRLRLSIASNSPSCSPSTPCFLW